MDKVEVSKNVSKKFHAKRDKDGNIIPYESRFGDRFTSLPSDLKAKIISQIHSLVLSHETTQALYLFDTKLPIFSKLTHLELESGSCVLQILPKLLKHSPCLEILEFTMSLHYRANVNYFSVDDIPSCFSSHLKVVKIYNFLGLENDLRIVEYFLKNAIVLEKLAIEHPPRGSSKYDIKGVFNLTKQLASMRRGSRFCKLEYI